MILSILNAIAAIPALLGYLEKFCAQVVGWYVVRQTGETLSALADAAALSARAKTDEDRYQAAKAWQDALSRKRIEP